MPITLKMCRRNALRGLPLLALTMSICLFTAPSFAAPAMTERTANISWCTSR